MGACDGANCLTTFQLAARDRLGNAVDSGASPRGLAGSYGPVLRTGERGELSPTLRWLIWHRDRGRCQICGAHASTIGMINKPPAEDTYALALPHARSAARGRDRPH
jgi:hypothetical protein